MSREQPAKDPYLVTEIANLRKVTTAPPTYFVTVDGQEVELDHKELMSWGRFKEAVMLAIDVLPEIYTAGLRQQTAWEMCLRELLSEIVRDEAPADASIEGIILDEARMWFRTMEVVEDATELEARTVIYQRPDGKLSFRGKHLFARLEPHPALHGLTMSRMWSALRKVGFEHGVEHTDGKVTTVKVWRAPATFAAPPNGTTVLDTVTPLYTRA